MKKLIIALGAFFALVITAGVCVSIVLSYQTFRKISKENKELKTELQSELTYLKEKLVPEEENTDPEYVTIAGVYKIEDTKEISDAYISKNDSALSETEKETLKLASDVLDSIIKDNMNLYEKEVAVHDWMVTNLKYDSNSLVAIPDTTNGLHQPHGVLTKKKAVCVGFATTFKLFMNMLGAECKIVHSTDLSHSWDLVKLEDGKWYLTDITFDAGNSFISYANFNCSEASFSQNHTWDTKLYPRAEGRKYNYCVQNAKDVTDIKKLPKMIKDAMDKKTTNLFYRLPANVDEGYIQSMTDGISNRVYNIVEYSSYYTIDENEQIIMGISMHYNDGAAKPGDYEKLNAELDELFGAISY